MKSIICTLSLLLTVSMATSCHHLRLTPSGCGSVKDIETLGEIKQLKDETACKEFASQKNPWAGRIVEWQKAVERVIEKSISSSVRRWLNRPKSCRVDSEI